MAAGHHAEDLQGFSLTTDESVVKRFLALPVAHKPGTFFAYSTVATYMQSAMVQKVTGQSVLEYLRPRLFEPLGIENPAWEQSKQGVSQGGTGLSIRTEDIAKFGQLYFAEGAVERETTCAGRVGGHGDGAVDVKREQPGERLGARLRFSILALPLRRDPRRWSPRAILHRDAGARCGGGDHGGHAEFAGRVECRVGEAAAGVAGESGGCARGG
jgi:CubicO group peptidase (beta-lactamase class C family)